jgi:outer membrane protein
MIAIACALAILSTGEPTGAPGNPRAETLQGERMLLLTPSEMLEAGELAATKGDTLIAMAIYEALEQDTDPEVRAEARFRAAKLMIQMNNLSQAAILLRRLVDEKPDAANVRIELARILHGMGDSVSSLRELRAAQAIGLPPEVARLVDRYSNALRAARPSGMSVEFAVAPDSNINRSTRKNALGTIFGDFDIGSDSQAKSGIGAAVRAQAYRRFSLGDPGVNLLVRATGLADLYRKSRYNDIGVNLTAGPEFRLGRSEVRVEIGITHRWYGQEPFTRSARVTGSLARPLGQRTQFRTSVAAGLVDNMFNDLQDGRNYGLELSIERALSPTHGIAVSLAADRQSLKDPGYSTAAIKTGLLGWYDIGRMTLTGEFEMGRLLADERLLLFPENRRDTSLRISLGATLRQFTIGAFSPVVRLVFERNHSTIQVYDHSRTRTELGFARAF